MKEELEENKYSIEKLNKIYNESESCDRDIFAEMRSNVLLMSGQHYKKISSGIDRNLRGLNVDKSKRLRLVKNHTAKAMSDIKDIFASSSPSFIPTAANENEASHSKVAELAKVALDDIKKKNNFEDLVEKFRNSFVDLGEVGSKVYYDPIGGGFKGYQQAVNEFGEPMFLDPNGQPTNQPGLIDPLTGQMLQQFEMMPDETKPIFKGKIVTEKIEPYNLLRAKNSTSVKTSKHLIYRKMVDLEDAKAIINASDMSDEDKEEKLKWIDESGETTYKIFDGASGGFTDSKGQTMFREYYFRQSPEFPKGYFFITVEKGILFEGELPFGEYGEEAFPIKWELYENSEGSARGYSPIKKIRPNQIEINRCSSSISETQLLHGRTKVVVNNAGKFSRGATHPGLDVYHVTGSGSVTVSDGKSGEQYLGYLEFNINELYSLSKIPENANPISENFDPKAELYKRQAQKARFSEPSQRFARFLKANQETALFFTQKYADQIELENILGPSLSTDINEFKNADSLCKKITLKEVTEDADSALAKTLELDTILQYAGKDLDPDTLGIILTQYPMINKTQAFKHINLDLKNVMSDILAMDRGEQRPANKYDKHEVYIKHLSSRMKEKDFARLPEQIKGLYQQKIKEHEEFITMMAQEQQRAQAGFIPTGGALVKTDYYVNHDPTNPAKAMRAMFPTEALAWLQKKLDEQGTTQDLMNSFGNQGAMTDVAGMLNQQQQGNPPMGAQGQMPMPPQGVPLPV